MMHEYLEHKTSTHVMEEDGSGATCMDSSTDSWSFDPATGGVVVSAADDSEKVRVPTPLKITHTADCNSTMELQLSTTAASDLAVTGTLSAGGVDLVQKLRKMGPFLDLTAWTIEPNGGILIDTGTYPGILLQRDTSDASYIDLATTNVPVSMLQVPRFATLSSAHMHVYLCADVRFGA